MCKHPIFTLHALTVACCLYAGGAHASAMLGAYVDLCKNWATSPPLCKRLAASQHHNGFA